MKDPVKREPASVPPPGIEARWHEMCPRCPEEIVPGDRIAFHHGRPIHVRCASGADDE